MQKIYFIVNGKNYLQCEKFSNLQEKIKDKFFITCLVTEKIADGINKAKQAAEEGADVVVAVGGDGTINEVANGIMQSNLEQKPLMAILPCGTGDDFVKTIKVRPLEDSLFDIKTKEIDTIKIHYQDENEQQHSRYCVNIGDIGVSALAVKIVNGSKKRLGSAFTFYVGTIRAFLSYKHNSVKIIAKEFQYEGKITTVVFANGNYFGGGIGIAPYAEIDDGLIDVTLVGDIKLTTFMKYYSRLRKKEHIHHPAVTYHKTQFIEIQAIKNDKYPLEADGEFFGYTPATIEILPKTLKLLL